MSLRESLGKLHFYLTFVAVNLTFFPQHFLGLAGMPRRYSDFSETFYAWNKISSAGAFLTMLSVMLFIYIMWEGFVSRRVVMSSFNSPSHLEFTPRLPVKFHSHPQALKVFY
jgi:heme/copper-type cytochrome/quinol oxidase subunit 1